MLKLGIVGGGQLGKMLVQSAADWNIYCKILDNDSKAPCSTLTNAFCVGSLLDFQTVYEFGKDCDIITIEIENVNTDALEQLEKEGKKVFPQPHIIRLIQDKRLQKQFYQDNNIPTAPFHLTNNKADLQKFANFLPAVHKLGKAGYDGKGVQKIITTADFDKGFEELGLLEKMVDFHKEIAVIVARNSKGEISTFPACEMVFHAEQNLVEYLFAPAQIAENEEKEANRIAILVAEKLGIVGILAVEMFVTKTGEILVNEVAPRPHNSGHHTIEANLTSQYQQHLRAIMNFPLGDTSQRCAAAMLNLLGENPYQGNAHYQGLEIALSLSGVYVHLYGKNITKPFRKMGHITILGENEAEISLKVEKVKEVLKVISLG
jgi:5-(carboxyamino)imidazole ribonucleotide synthase